MEYTAESWTFPTDESLLAQTIIDTDSIRALELKEMQEEEMYLKLLKTQTSKIESFKQEVRKKDEKIEELQKSLKELTFNSPKIKELQQKISALLKEFELKDIEIHELRSKVKNQAEDYENSLKEVQMIVYKERDEKNSEIKSLKKRISELEASKTISTKLSDLEEKLQIELKSNRDKERQALESQKSWRNLEKLLKDQITSLTVQNHDLQSKLDDLSTETSLLYTKLDLAADENSQMFHKFEQVERLSDLAKEFKRLKDSLSSAELKEKELIAYNSKIKAENSEMSEELVNLQDELNKAVSIVKRQEASMVELRNKNQESLRVIEGMQDENLCLKKQMMNVNKNLDMKDDEIQRWKNRFEAKEKEAYQNDEFVRKMREKENTEKIERQRHAKMKMQLLNQRAAEVNKLAEVIQSFTFENRYSFEDKN